MSVPAMAHEVEIADAVPTTVGNTPGLVANPNPLNTPPATGLLAPPQSPSGVITTNTGRTAMAMQTFLLTISPNTKTAQGQAQITNSSGIPVIAGNPNAAFTRLF